MLTEISDSVFLIGAGESRHPKESYQFYLDKKLC